MSKRSAKLVELSKLFWFTTIVDEEDAEIVKAKWHQALDFYGKDRYELASAMANYWRRFAGLSKEESQAVIDVLRRAIRGNWVWNKERVVRALMRAVPKLTRYRAETIATTELANVANVARMLAYREETRVTKFVWVTERDRRVCDKCKRLAEITRRRGGATLAQLQFLLRQVCGAPRGRWTCHPNCRCTFRRAYRSGYEKPWE